jgi:hypothetical protein
MKMPKHQLTWQGSNIAKENQPEASNYPFDTPREPDASGNMAMAKWQWHGMAIRSP